MNNEKINTLKERLQQPELTSQRDESPVWTYVNSPLVIWFLSTIVISIVSFSYNYYQSKSTSYFVNQEKTRKLDLEITSRLNQLARKSSLFKSDQEQFIKILLLVNKVELSEFPIGVAQEYEKRHISSLILELMSIIQMQKENNSFILPQPAIGYDTQLAELEKAFSAAEKFIILFDDLKRQSLKNRAAAKIKPDSSMAKDKNNIKKSGSDNLYSSLILLLSPHLKDIATNILKSLTWKKHFNDLNLARWGYPFRDTIAIHDSDTTQKTKGGNQTAEDHNLWKDFQNDFPAEKNNKIPAGTEPAAKPAP